MQDDRGKRKFIHLYWTIGVLIGIIILLLTYKFWGKSGSLESLISIGSGLVSIALALVAIFITLSESIKTSIKENRLDETLGKIILNTNRMELVLNNQQPVMEDIKRMMLGIDVTALGYKLHEEDKKEIDHSKTITVSDSVKNLEQDTIKPCDRSINNEIKENDFTRGSIYYANMQPSIGSELRGVRPVIIVSNDISNKFSPNVTVIAITSQINKPKLPTHVALSNILEIPSVALAEQVRTIDKSRLYEFVAKLDKETLKRLDKAIEIQFGITEI
jgi:mRNA-degrading endonuclease toxin of MazEF toxin-antitoxin module